MSYRINSGSSAFQTSTASTPGTYNSGRRVPPPRTTTLGSSSQAHSSDLTIPAGRFGSSTTSSKLIERDAYFVEVMSFVDDATEPGTTDEEAVTHRQKIIGLLTGNAPPEMPRKTRQISDGDAVSVALRGRLKSEDETVVLNTLILLDEIMRTVPYFYRHVANDKFFRRLWRFVVPDYKNQVRSLVPIFGRSRPNLVGMQGFDSEITKRVLTLIRAWAEELSIMFHGRADTDAGFLIERYRSKRARFPFPDVPKTSTPWVCPIPSSSGTSRYPTLRARNRAGGGGSSSSNAHRMMSLDEVENTVKLFRSVVDGASTSQDVKDEVCADLASRCIQISDSLTTLSSNWDKDEELSRTISTSELLHRSLEKYNALLNGLPVPGERSRSNEDSVGALPARISGIDSDDDSFRESYSDNDSLTHNVGKLSVRSDRSAANKPSGPRYEGDRRSSAGEDRFQPPRGPSSARPPLDKGLASRELSRHRSVDDRGLQSRERDFDRERGREIDQRERLRGRQREEHPPRSRDDLDLRRNSRLDGYLDHNDRHDRPRSRVREELTDDRRERFEERPSASWDEYVERKEKKGRASTSSVSSRRGREDNAPADKRDRERKAAVSKKGSGGTSKRSKSDDDDTESSSKGGSGSNINKKKNVTGKNKPSEKKTLIKYDEDEEFDDDDDDDDNQHGAFHMLAERFPAPTNKKGPRRSSGGQNANNFPNQASVRGGENSTGEMVPMQMGPMGMYSGHPGMGMNPMMVMQPNPYAMYQTMSPVGMPDGMGMYGGYSSMNPAMYYQSVNPGMMSPMNRMGSGGPPMNDASGAGPGGMGMNSMPMGMNMMNSMPPMHMGMGMGQGQQGMNQPMLNKSMTSGPGDNERMNTTQQDMPHSATNPPNMMRQPQAAHPGNEADGAANSGGAMVNMNAGGNAMGGMTMPGGMGGMQGMGGMGMGGMGMEAQNPAAMYQSAMHQAATAYHMAANAYRTMQGQAAIGPPMSSVTSSSNMGAVVDGQGGSAGDSTMGAASASGGDSGGAEALT